MFMLAFTDTPSNDKVTAGMYLAIAISTILLIALPFIYVGYKKYEMWQTVWKRLSTSKYETSTVVLFYTKSLFKYITI